MANACILIIKSSSLDLVKNLFDLSFFRSQLAFINHFLIVDMLNLQVLFLFVLVWWWVFFCSIFSEMIPSLPAMDC